VERPHPAQFEVIQPVLLQFLVQLQRNESQRRPTVGGFLHIGHAEAFVLIAVDLFIYLYACYSHNSKSIKPNRMKFGGMI